MSVIVLRRLRAGARAFRESVREFRDLASGRCVRVAGARACVSGLRGRVSEPRGAATVFRERISGFRGSASESPRTGQGAWRGAAPAQGPHLAWLSVCRGEDLPAETPNLVATGGLFATSKPLAIRFAGANDDRFLCGSFADRRGPGASEPGADRARLVRVFKIHVFAICPAA